MVIKKFRWQILWANLDPVSGSEQAGNRPVLVVSAEEVNQALPIVTVLPLTSTKRKVYPTEVFLKKEKTGLPRDSIVMAHQIRTISKNRLGEKCGMIEDTATREKIRTAIKRHLGFF